MKVPVSAEEEAQAYAERIAIAMAAVQAADEDQLAPTLTALLLPIIERARRAEADHLLTHQTWARTAETLRAEVAALKAENEQWIEAAGVSRRALILLVLRAEGG